jgi:hypothetical protein
MRQISLRPTASFKKHSVVSPRAPGPMRVEEGCPVNAPPSRPAIIGPLRSRTLKVQRQSSSAMKIFEVSFHRHEPAPPGDGLRACPLVGSRAPGPMPRVRFSNGVSKPEESRRSPSISRLFLVGKI